MVQRERWCNVNDRLKTIERHKKYAIAKQRVECQQEMHERQMLLDIQARSKGLDNAFLVVARNHENVALRRWYLFREDLLVCLPFYSMLLTTPVLLAF